MQLTQPDRLAAARLGLSLDVYKLWRSLRAPAQITAKASIAHLGKWERDPFTDETPRESRARVARDLAEGRRCKARMFGGGPCSLLLPCATHG